MAIRLEVDFGIHSFRSEPFVSREYASLSAQHLADSYGVFVQLIDGEAQADATDKYLVVFNPHLPPLEMEQEEIVS